MLSSGCAGLVTGVDELSAQSIDAVDATALGGQLIAMQRQMDRLEAEFARRLRRFEEKDGPRQAGATSVIAWLRTRCALSAAAASQRAEVARQLPELPEAARLFRQGSVGFHHAAVLARSVTEIGREAAQLATGSLLEAASRMDPTEFRTVARNLRQTVDPEGALAAALRANQRRYLHMNQTFDGVYMLDGLLDAEGGAALSAALQGLSAPIPGDERTGAQRRADALVELANRQLQGGSLPTVHGQRPHLVLTATVDGLRGADGAAPPSLGLAGPIPTDAARRLACDSAATDSDDDRGEPGSRSRRTVPSALRRALSRRDKGCRYPGCDRPPEWTDAHHVVHWVDGGPTTLSNLVLLCRIHHRRVHEEGGWPRASIGTIEVAQPP